MRWTGVGLLPNYFSNCLLFGIFVKLFLESLEVVVFPLISYPQIGYGMDKLVLFRFPINISLTILVPGLEYWWVTKANMYRARPGKAK